MRPQGIVDGPLRFNLPVGGPDEGDEEAGDEDESGVGGP